jgi:hypothetical protein
MNNVLKRWLVLPALIVLSTLCAQDEKSLAYFAIRLDTTSLTYLNKAKGAARRDKEVEGNKGTGLRQATVPNTI